MQLGLSLGALALLTSFVSGLLGAGGAVLLIPLALYVRVCEVVGCRR